MERRFRRYAAAGLLALAFLVCGQMGATATAADVTASVTAPGSVSLATSQPSFKVLVNIISGDIDPASVTLSLPGYPAAGNIAPLSTKSLGQGLLEASFESDFLSAAPLPATGLVLLVSGTLTDGVTTFSGEATVDTWKPLTVTGLTLADARGRDTTTFNQGVPIWLTVAFNVDPRTPGYVPGLQRLKASLLVDAFGRKVRSNWTGVARGSNSVSFTVLVPPGTPLGATPLSITLRLKKGQAIYDQAVVSPAPVVTVVPGPVYWQP